MRQDWFELSLEDGNLKATKAPGDCKRWRWTECDIENLLALNPDFLGLSDYHPLRLRGVRGTVTSPDQAYVDKLGRLAVIEVKKIRSALPVLAQVIAYATHWAALPPGETAADLADLSNPTTRAYKFGQALVELTAWANGCEPGEADGHECRKGEVVLQRMRPRWVGWDFYPELLARPTGKAFPGIGAPPRLIAVAPEFSDDAIDFAESLSQRMVPIELVEVDVVKERGRILVGRRLVHRDAESEATWQLFRRAWAKPEIQEYFRLNGWADALNRESFSLSANAAPDAKLWLQACEDKALVYTALPSGWYRENRRKRKELRELFLKELPGDAEGRWLAWEFVLPRHHDELMKCIVKVANAICRILVPAAKEARHSHLSHHRAGLRS